MSNDVRSADDDEVRDWLGSWAAEVAGRDFDSAERRMSGDVVGFGTRATIAVGRAALRADQWEHVWPAIESFEFDVEGAVVWVSPDRLQAVIGASWSSVGRTPAGDTFPRGGRATVVVSRPSFAEPWLGCHTHFSLEPVGPGTYTGTSS